MKDSSTREERIDRERAARAWRAAKDPAQAWKRFRAFVARVAPDVDDDGDVPHWSLSLQCSESWLGPNVSGLVVFHKRNVLNAFIGPGPESRAEKLRVAIYQAPFAPRPCDTELLRSIAKLTGAASLGFVGDLSPFALHLFGTLRSGAIDAPRLDAKSPLNLKWLGIDDSWLRDAAERKSGRLAMGWIEREYWGILKRLMPTVHSLIGPESFALLEEVFKHQSDDFRDVMGDELARRLKPKRPSPRRSPV